MKFPFCVSLAVIGGLVYQVSMKQFGGTANVFSLLAGAYFAAGLLAIALCFLLPALGVVGAGISTPAQPTWASIPVAIGILLIELGYALALGPYQIPLSQFTPTVLVTVSVAVSLVGILLLSEPISAPRFLGLAMCIGGILLTNFSR
jgi:drug/metabolite transporter (DMT)-like permease